MNLWLISGITMLIMSIALYIYSIIRMIKFEKLPSHLKKGDRVIEKPRYVRCYIFKNTIDFIARLIFSTYLISFRNDRVTVTMIKLAMFAFFLITVSYIFSMIIDNKYVIKA